MREDERMLYANFNQDFSCISIGTTLGYSITNCDPFGRVYTSETGACSIVEMLFCTSLLALASHRKLQIVNTKRKSLICELLFPTAVLGVKMNRKTLCVVLEAEVYVYDISNMRLVHVVDVGSGAAGGGVVALSANTDSPWLCYPGPKPGPSPMESATATTEDGTIHVLSTRTLTLAALIHAHRSPLALLALSTTGSLLASASEKGTVVRVHAVPSGQRLYQFRRGAREARIWSMNFNAVGSLLAVTGGSTVHVFRMENTTPPTDGESVSEASVDVGYESFAKDSGSRISSTLLKRSSALTKSLSTYLPGAVTEMWEPQRDFAYFKLPAAMRAHANTTATPISHLVAFAPTTPHIHLVSSEGFFYAYAVDLERGGECVLGRSFDLLGEGGS